MQTMLPESKFNCAHSVYIIIIIITAGPGIRIYIYTLTKPHKYKFALIRENNKWFNCDPNCTSDFNNVTIYFNQIDQ